MPLPVAVWVTTPKRLGTAGIGAGAGVGGSRPDGGHRLTDATAARRCHRHFFFSFVVVVVVVPFHHTGLIDSIGPEANVAVASILFAAFLLVDGSIPIEIDSDQVRVDFRSRFFYWLDLFFLWIEFDPTFDLAKHLRASPFVCFRRFFLFPMTSILRKCFVFSEFFTFFCHFMRLVSDRPSLRVNSHPYDCNR